MQEIPKLDRLDQKLLLELYCNGRAGNSELGKKLHASKEVTNYRVNRLQEKGIIKKFIPLINFSRLGYTIYRTQLKFREKPAEPETFFKTISQTSWIVELQGNWDLVVLFWIKNNPEFFQIINQIQERFQNNIQDMLITIVNSIYHLPPKYLSRETVKEKQYYQIGLSTEKSFSLDEVQTRIIKELLADGRISILTLAHKIGYSATNVTYHLKKLMQEKIIVGFIPLIDHTKIGLTHFKVTLNLNNPTEKKKVKEILFNSPITIYITESYGHYDLEFEVITPNINTLFDFIQEIDSQTRIKKHEIIFNNKEIVVNEVPL